MNRRERHGAILRVVREQAISTQTDLAEALRRAGYDVVQTTVSRDIAELGLVNARALHGRAEELGQQDHHRERYDIVTARACASMPVLVEYALPLIRAGGSLLAWKGALTADDDEIRTGAAAAQLMGGGTPSIHGAGMGSLGTHRLVVVEKDRATPAGYPRRPGEPARRPLAH